MDRVDKLLRKLSLRERQKVFHVIGLILTGNLDGLDIKKLKGRSGQFRVRVGDIRIIFIHDKNMLHIISADRRSDTTYR